MVYPPPIIKAEYTVLKAIQMLITQKSYANAGRTTPRESVEWDQLREVTGIENSAFGNYIAHLIAHDFIDGGWQTPNILARLFGAKEKHFFGSPSKVSSFYLIIIQIKYLTRSFHQRATS